LQAFGAPFEAEKSLRRARSLVAS